MKSFNQNKSQQGMTLISVIMASTISLIILSGMTSLLTNAFEQKKSLSSEIDAAGLQMDIKRKLLNNDLCKLYFVNENKVFNKSSKKINLRIGSNEIIKEKTDLMTYALKAVFLSVKDTKYLGKNKIGNKFYSTNIFLNARKSTKQRLHLKPKNIGTLFISTTQLGRPLECSSASLSNLVKCKKGELKVSSGKNEMPNCQSAAEVVASVCPAGRVIVANGKSVSCQNLPSRSTSTKTSTTTASRSKSKSASKCTARPEICSIYKSRLGRVPDQAGADFYSNKLKGKTGSALKSELDKIDKAVARSAEGTGNKMGAKERRNYNNYKKRTGTTGASCKQGVNCK